MKKQKSIKSDIKKIKDNPKPKVKSQDYSRNDRSKEPTDDIWGELI